MTTFLPIPTVSGNASFVLGILAASPLLLSPLEALELRNYSSERHDRFTNFPGSPVHSTTFIHKDVDLTGVGWYPNDPQPRSITLVSPKYFVCARHFRPTVGQTVRFVASDGTLRIYNIAGYFDILNDEPPETGGPKPTDLALGELVEAVLPTDGVRFQPYLNLPSEADYLTAPNNQLIVLGKSARGGRGTASNIIDLSNNSGLPGANRNRTRALEFVYQTFVGGQDDAAAEQGDSGSPSLVNVNNRGALVGVHSAIVSTLGSITTIDNFVPHPPYISQINTIMAADGYHMTKACPAAVTLSLSADLAPSVRAGYPVSLALELENTDPAEDANNVKISHSLPPGSSALSTNGSQWFDESSGSSIAARKAGLPATQSTSLSTTFTPSAPGSYSILLEHSADEFSTTSQHLPLEVIESYLSWSADLSNSDPDVDIDLDGINNLLEYAFGGDPEVTSAYQPDGVTRLAPVSKPTSNEDETSFEFLRRKDAAQRALSYDLESSSTLQPDSWSDATADILQTQTTSLDDDFERVTLTLHGTGDPNYYRVKVTLSESDT